jgi:hypothetical protein
VNRSLRQAKEDSGGDGLKHLLMSLADGQLNVSWISLTKAVREIHSYIERFCDAR